MFTVKMLQEVFEIPFLSMFLNLSWQGECTLVEFNRHIYYRLCERGSSAVECWTRNREIRPGSNFPFATVSKFGHFRSLHSAPLSCINEYLAIDGG